MMGYISIKLFLFILFIHYLGDFSLQTHEQAQRKSKDNLYLLYHVLTYSITWFFASLIWYEKVSIALLFALFTFIAHYITDYFTSRWASKYFGNKDYHHGFMVIGFDQILHYVQLLLTFMYLDLIFKVL